MPWIGPASRIGDVVPKTEVLKGLANRPTAEPKPRKGPCLDEEELLRLMESKKVKLFYFKYSEVSLLTHLFTFFLLLKSFIFTLEIQAFVMFFFSSTCHLQASRSELIKACSDLGVSTEGSETDLINRLEEMLLYKDVYPKMYVKLQRTGGKNTIKHLFEHITYFKLASLSRKDIHLYLVCRVVVLSNYTGIELKIFEYQCFAS